MAISTRSSLLFFFLSFLLFSTQTNARDSYSFGKFQRENPKDQSANNNVVPIQTNETNEQEDQNPAFIPQTETGYGLYGHETTYNNNNEELNNKEYDENVNYDDSFSTPSLSQTQESYKNYGESYPKTTESYPKTTENHYDNNNKDTSYYENSNGYDGTEKRERDAYKGYSNNVQREGMRDAYKGYSNNVQRQGMSDTRFMSNGKYYYDLDDDRNHGLFYQKQNYNYNPNGYNEKETSFERRPYNSKNMMNQQQSQMYGDQQPDQFTP